MKQLSIRRIHLTSQGTPQFHRSLLNSTGCSSIPQEATLLSKDTPHFTGYSSLPQISPQLTGYSSLPQEATLLSKDTPHFHFVLLTSSDLSSTPQGTPHLHIKQLSFRMIHLTSTLYSSLPQILITPTKYSSTPHEATLHSKDTPHFTGYSSIPQISP